MEHNPYALSVWRRVKAKLEGRDTVKDVTLPPATVQQQVRIKRWKLERSFGSLVKLYVYIHRDSGPRYCTVMAATFVSYFMLII